MSKRRNAANRKNAAHSTGPKSETGKQKSSLNALRHGFTGQVVVLPTENRITYFKHTSAFHNEYHPQGPTETHLVQTLADAAWRLNRLRAIEDNLLTIGLIDQQDRRRAPETNLPEANIALATANGTKDHLRQIAILSVHEGRLTRQFTKTLSLLKELQAERKAQAAAVASLFQPVPHPAPRPAAPPVSAPKNPTEPDFFPSPHVKTTAA